MGRRLAESYLVREDRAAAHRRPEHAHCDLDLVRQLLDPVLVQRDQAVEAGGQGEFFGCAAQAVPVFGERLRREESCESIEK